MSTLRRRGETSPRNQDVRRALGPPSPHRIIARSSPTAVPLPVVRTTPTNGASEASTAGGTPPIPDYIKRLGAAVEIVGNERATFKNTLGSSVTRNNEAPPGAYMHDYEAPE